MATAAQERRSPKSMIAEFAGSFVVAAKSGSIDPSLGNGQIKLK